MRCSCDGFFWTRSAPCQQLQRHVGFSPTCDPTVEAGDLLGLLAPAAPGRLEAFPVSTLVSNVRNNGPELVESLPLEGEA